ncbi:hypothetical protein CARUB_v10027324mg [Capsella rubella]|uniref:FLZ-type domain-containing protein n=1 Tax=Capsella rubella TaxID=81985 RepID=R0GBZ0_9BRAS|nr:uncharacterized protein LOC17875460 [Capsella rubella]EOA14174.1 hypothetical protein CARUB_v10027324mg [Capsella rubella]
MVGLSIVLEMMTNNNNNTVSDGGCLISPKVINKANVIVSSSTTYLRRHCQQQDSDFLQHCFLCRRKLLPAKDIYMYKGDRAFCSVECRSKQMVTDEEDSLRRDYCYVNNTNTTTKTTKKNKKSDSPVTVPSRYSRDPSNQRGGFVY